MQYSQQFRCFAPFCRNLYPCDGADWIIAVDRIFQVLEVLKGASYGKMEGSKYHFIRWLEGFEMRLNRSCSANSFTIIGAIVESGYGI